ncbi:MAG: large subunit ribosomal protein L25 [Parcubacteria group bacterium Athens0714_24]|nr:MAG: large subunit ribosomal protein L25 [Parcubacteria group bacterium Athens0714_24]
MPAVLYGKGKKTTPLFVDLKNFKKVLKEAGESTLINIKNPETGATENVLIQDVDIDPIANEPVHADFYIVEMDKSIRTEVALIFEGASPAEKEQGGVLIKVLHNIEIEALPKDLPHELKIDVSKLANIGDQIFIKDIELPAGVKIIAKEDEVVVLVEAHKEEVIEEKPISMEDIEVEERGKKEEEGEEVTEPEATESKK